MIHQHIHSTQRCNSLFPPVIDIRIVINDLNILMLLRIGRLPRIGRFLPKTWKASAEERCVHTTITFRNAVQLHLQIFWSWICVFQSCICNGKVAQYLDISIFFFTGQTTDWRQITDDRWTNLIA